MYFQQEEWGKAAQLTEQKVLSESSTGQPSLYTLTELAIREDRTLDAEQIADIARQITDLFGLWECSTYIADFQLAVYGRMLTDALPPCVICCRRLVKHGNRNVLPCTAIFR